MDSLWRGKCGLANPTFVASALCGSLCIDGVVRNLTVTGAMFESCHWFTVGDKVCLEVDGFGSIPASVVWSIGPRAGVRFDEPSTPAMTVS